MAPTREGGPAEGHTEGAAEGPAEGSARADRSWHESRALDEVGVPVGPERDTFGLFDAPNTGTATREYTGGPVTGDDPRGGSRRTAVLAWIAASEPVAHAEAGAPQPEGLPCAALKRLIADEPLDPVPALDGVPPRMAARHALPEREDTATQIEGLPPRRDSTDTNVGPPRPTPARGLDVRALMYAAIGAALLAAILRIFA